jgi:hypothetical protein
VEFRFYDEFTCRWLTSFLLLQNCKELLTRHSNELARKAWPNKLGGFFSRSNVERRLTTNLEYCSNSSTFFCNNYMVFGFWRNWVYEKCAFDVEGSSCVTYLVICATTFSKIFTFSTAMSKISLYSFCYTKNSARCWKRSNSTKFIVWNSLLLMSWIFSLNF